MIDTFTRLTFESHTDYLAFIEGEHARRSALWRWQQIIGNSAERIKSPGICDLCTRQTDYTIQPRPVDNSTFPHAADWWYGLMCGCGMNSLNRAVYRAFLDTGGNAASRIYHVGHHSPFSRWLAKR